MLLAMLELQLLRRLIESIYIFHYSPLARMHILGYLFGLGYILFYSIFIAASSWSFCGNADRVFLTAGFIQLPP